MGAFAMLSWGFFAVLVALIVIGGIVVLRRYRRWTPTEGTSAEARQAQARLFGVRQGGERR
jgi:hypothetical protein